MRPFHKSLRWRLQAWHSLILLVVLVAFGITAFWLVRENSLKRIDAELQRRIMVLLSGFGPPPPGEMRNRRFEPGFRLPREHRALFEGDGTESYYYSVTSTSGTLTASSQNAPANIPGLQARSATSEPVARQRGEFRELVLVSTRQMPPAFVMEQKDASGSPTPSDRSAAFFLAERFSGSWLLPIDVYAFRRTSTQTVVVGCSIAPLQAELHHLAWGFSVAGLAVVLLGLAMGWHLSARAIKPIDTIRHTARVVAGGNLAARIQVKDSTTELGELAGVLNETFGRLQSAFARQAQFTADASHELRTPTFVILLQTQAALKRERSPEEYREALGICEMAAKQMRQLVESLLILARQDGSASDLHRAPCGMQEMVTDSVNLLRAFAADRRVELNLDLKPAMAWGDVHQLKQVIANLVVNAVEYNQPGGEVHVTVSREMDEVVLTVRDNGVGISSRDLPYVFDRFYRADNVRSTAEGHTGLGLSICKSIVESHRGTISVESEPGKGTTFTVVLPAAPSASLRDVPQAITPSITFP